jgi:putative tricarboxylic transport membrane protein
MLERIVLAALFALGGIYFYAADMIEVPRLGDPVGPRAFPLAVAIAFLAACAGLVVEMVAFRRGATEIGTSETSTTDFRHEAMGIVAIVLTAAYFAAFEAAGFVLATFAYLSVMTCLLRRHHIAVNVLVAALFSIGSYLMFVRLLGVRLPAGVLPF